MRETLIFLASLSLVLGLRSGKSRFSKKLAAFLFILTMSYLGYALSNHIAGAVFMASIWFFIPLINIYTKRANRHYPFLLKEIKILSIEKESFFPNASNYKAQLESLEFEPLGNRSWQWLETNQHHRFYWNPELHTVASVCLCELENIAFTYVIFHSVFIDETVVRTTNYPFVSPLKHQPKSCNKHVACEEVSLENILKAHKSILEKKNTNPCSLRTPDPESVYEHWGGYLSEKLEYNLERGLIKQQNDTFQFTSKGLVYLWIQSIIDLIRLC